MLSKTDTFLNIAALVRMLLQITTHKSDLSVWAVWDIMKLKLEVQISTDFIKYKAGRLCRGNPGKEVWK